MEAADDLPAVFQALRDQGFSVTVDPDGRAVVAREGCLVVCFRGSDLRARRNAIVQARSAQFVWPDPNGGPGQD